MLEGFVVSFVPALPLLVPPRRAELEGSNLCQVIHCQCVNMGRAFRRRRGVRRAESGRGSGVNGDPSCNWEDESNCPILCLV